jgi:hypothetical protein
MMTLRQDCPTHTHFSHELSKRNLEIYPPRFFTEERDGIVKAKTEEEAIKKIVLVLYFPDRSLIALYPSTLPDTWEFKLPKYVCLRELTQADIDNYPVPAEMIEQ